jgi:hypothetical protein
MSIVKRHQRKVLESVLIGVDHAKGKDTTAFMAVKKSSSATDASREHVIMDEFDFFKVAMESDLAQLKKFSDIADKSDYKAKAIEQHQYLDYLRRYQAEGANHPNVVFAWVVIWLVDLGHWKTALDFLPLLVEQQQHLPTAFNTKDWPTFFVDQLYDEGAKHLAKGRDAIERSQVMQLFDQFVQLSDNAKWPLSELIGGKLYAMAAKLEFTVFNLGNAYTYCLKATAVNDKAGVKKMAREIAKTIGKETDL